MGAVQNAMQFDVQFQIIGSHERTQEARYVRLAIQAGVDSIIVYPTPDLPNKSLFRELLANHFPYVMVNRFIHMSILIG